MAGDAGGNQIDKKSDVMRSETNQSKNKLPSISEFNQIIYTVKDGNLENEEEDNEQYDK